MSRLPVVGSDDNDWGNVLNDFLSQSLNPDGSLKNFSLTGGTTGYVLTQQSDGSFAPAAVAQQAYASVSAQTPSILTAPNPAILTWSNASSEGSPGMALQPDNQTWKCIQAGLYEIHIESYWRSTGTPDTKGVMCQTSINAVIADPESPWNSNYGGYQGVWLNSTLTNDASFPWTLPLLKFEVGDTFKFTVDLTNDGGTMSANYDSGSNVTITQIATYS